MMCNVVMIHFSLSFTYSLFGTCIATVIMFTFPYGVYIIVIVAYVFSLFSSCAAGYNVILLFVHISIPAPSGVLCLFSLSIPMLLYSCLVYGCGMWGFLSSYIPDSITYMTSILFLYDIFLIFPSLFIWFFPYGIPLILCMAMFIVC